MEFNEQLNLQSALPILIELHQRLKQGDSLSFSSIEQQDLCMKLHSIIANSTRVIDEARAILELLERD